TSRAEKSYSIEKYLEIYDRIGTFGVGYAPEWEIKKFAEKLKQVASILLNIPVEKFEDQEFKNTTLSEEWDMYVLYNSKGNGYGSKAEISATAKELLEAYPDFGADPEGYKKSITVRQFLQW